MGDKPESTATRSSLTKTPKPKLKPDKLERMEFHHLDTLHDAFLDRWHGEDRGLTKEEFLSVVRNKLYFDVDMSDVELIYTKVDPRETGLMRWSDYITSVCQTAQLKAYMASRATKPLFKDKMTFINTRHRDEIVKICFIPRLSLQSTKINYNSGRYIMLGREGTLTMWSINICCIGSFYIGATEGHKSLFYVDMVILYPSTMIAVTSTDRKITIYEIGSRGIKEKYSIVTLGNSATCMDFWSDLSSRTFSLLVWGDTGGDIHALEFNVNRLGGIFDKDQNREIITRVIYADLVKNKIPVAHLRKVVGVHDDWVTAVKYIPENRAFLSSSRSTSKQSLVYSDWFGKADTRYYSCSKAVLCFDYSHVVNVLVTGCLDCRVRVWNFFMANRPVNTLVHTAPLSHVSLNIATHHVISVDKNRAIKVFDYLMGTVIQSFSGPSSSWMGEHSQISGFFFNTVRCQFIIATNKLATATKRVNPAYMAEVSAHDYPITAVCYSSAMQTILTACMNAVISVWDVHTGKHLLEFQHFSPRCQFREEPWAKHNVRLEISVMTLDTSELCAVTGSSDGTVNLWNFSSGVLLCYYELPEATMVTGLAVDRNVIFATGWFNQVYLLNREQKSAKENLKSFSRLHNEEVNCLTLVKGGLLATGSYDGDIIVVLRDTGHPTCRLNAGQSATPIAMRVKRVEESQDEAGGSGAVVVPTVDEQSENEELTSTWSEESEIETEDHSILRGIRLTKSLVMVADTITGECMRLIHKPKAKKEADDGGPKMVYDVLRGEKVSPEESEASFRAYESSVEVLLCLQTRKPFEINTANIISAGAEGWIRAWSLNPKGGLKGQFLATERLGEAVKAMTIDQADEFLITGDTMGYIKVWDLFPYCNAAAKLMSEKERQDRRNRFSNMFIYLRSPFLRDVASEGFKRCVKFHKRRPPHESNPDVTLKTPNLLNVFRAHMQAITTLHYDNTHQLIISGGKDCSVRVWTIKGTFVGHCGAPWAKLPDMSAAVTCLRILPHDLRRHGSARTFRVTKAGCVPMWEHAVRMIKSYLEEQKRDERKKARLEAMKAEARARGEAKEEDVEEESALTPALPMAHEEELPEEMRLTNIVKFDWQDPKKSQILGKSFKPTLHHRASPIPSVQVSDDYGMVPAYRKVKIIDIARTIRIPTPQTIKDLEHRRREEEEEAQKWRNAHSKGRSIAKPNTSLGMASSDSSCGIEDTSRKTSAGTVASAAPSRVKGVSRRPGGTNNNSARNKNDNSFALVDKVCNLRVDTHDTQSSKEKNCTQSNVLDGTDTKRSFFLTSCRSDCLFPVSLEAASCKTLPDQSVKPSSSLSSDFADISPNRGDISSPREDIAVERVQADVNWSEKPKSLISTCGLGNESRLNRNHDDRPVKYATTSGGLFPPLSSDSAKQTLLVVPDSSDGQNDNATPCSSPLHPCKIPKLPCLTPSKRTKKSLFKGTGLVVGGSRLPTLPKCCEE